MRERVNTLNSNIARTPFISFIFYLLELLLAFDLLLSNFQFTLSCFNMSYGGTSPLFCAPFPPIFVNFFLFAIAQASSTETITNMEDSTRWAVTVETMVWMAAELVDLWAGSLK